MNFLDRILDNKKAVIEEAKKTLPFEELKELVAGKGRSADLRRALERRPDESIRVIAEIKRSSPSKGVIAPSIDPASVASDYRDGGVSAISVLTENSYFKGTGEDLRSVRKAVPAMPLLRKDFIISQYQIYESLLLGADAVLLIVAALEKPELMELTSTAAECGLDCLVEVHHEKELDAAIAAGADIVGVNNRDLTTFQVSPEVSVRLSKLIPSEVISVCESGITDLDALESASRLGYHAALIGEHFMRAKDRVTEVKRFTSARAVVPERRMGKG